MDGDTTMREALEHVQAAVRVLEAAADEQQGRPLELGGQGYLDALTVRQLCLRIGDELQRTFLGLSLLGGR